MVVNTVENPTARQEFLYEPRSITWFQIAFERFGSNEKIVKYRGKFESQSAPVSIS
jgi:hypothetical protein